MSELRFPSAAVWKEFRLKTDLLNPPVIQLLIKPCFKRDIARLVYANRRPIPSGGNEALLGLFESQADHAFKLVEGWELTLPGGEAIPCTDENKKKYLVPLLWENVEPDPEEKPKEADGETIELGAEETPVLKPRKKTLWLFGAITDFAVKAENFLKN
jgi:hypothetical protein